jgi:hypothetical protein
MNFINKIIITSLGLERVSGEYNRTQQTEEVFISNEGNFIELTIDGWFLVDKITNEQIFLFDKDFKNVYLVGDCIEPIPTFSVFFNQVT